MKARVKAPSVSRDSHSEARNARVTHTRRLRLLSQLRTRKQARHKEQGYWTLILEYDTKLLIVHGVKGVVAFPFSKKGFFSPREKGQNESEIR
jgi:hypothetical protein